MEQKKYSIETMYQIWNDRTGERIELGPDRDGLELFEIRQLADDGSRLGTITMTPEELEKLYVVIGRAIISELALERKNEHDS